MTLDEFFNRVEANGAIFTATFVKRTDEQDRTMNCRLGVTKALKGGELAYDPAAYNLRVVYDVQKRAYRMINLDTLDKIKCGGYTFSYDTNNRILVEDPT